MPGKRRKLRKMRCLIAVLALLTIANFCFGNSSAQADDKLKGRELQPIQVCAGDTLWDLVSENYDYEGDIREAIYEVKKINGMERANISPGQIIYIPRV